MTGKKKFTFMNNNIIHNNIIYSFYQICLYKDENKNMYGIRKINFNDKLEIIDVKINYFAKKIINDFIEEYKNKENKFKMCPYNDINLVPFPSMSDLNASKSNLLY